MPIARQLKYLMVFADGENLVARYQGMMDKGRIPKQSVSHVKDVYVWSRDMTFTGTYTIARAIYYASANGDDAQLRAYADAIRKIRVLPEYIAHWAHENPWYPKVFKRARGAGRSKGVDIQLAVDAMSNIYQGNCEAIMLCSGDGDYAPLLEESIRKGQQVLIAAFSDGLSDRLTNLADQLVILDDYYFETAPSNPSVQPTLPTGGAVDAKR